MTLPRLWPCKAQLTIACLTGKARPSPFHLMCWAVARVRCKGGIIQQWTDSSLSPMLLAGYSIQTQAHLRDVFARNRLSDVYDQHSVKHLYCAGLRQSAQALWTFCAGLILLLKMTQWRVGRSYHLADFVCRLPLCRMAGKPNHFEMLYDQAMRQGMQPFKIRVNQPCNVFFLLATQTCSDSDFCMLRSTRRGAICVKLSAKCNTRSQAATINDR